MKKTELISMLHEVDQRYRQYHHQMQVVVSSFEQAVGCCNVERNLEVSSDDESALLSQQSQLGGVQSVNGQSASNHNWSADLRIPIFDTEGIHANNNREGSDRNEDLEPAPVLSNSEPAPVLSSSDGNGSGDMDSQAHGQTNGANSVFPSESQGLEPTVEEMSHNVDLPSEPVEEPEEALGGESVHEAVTDESVHESTFEGHDEQLVDNERLGVFTVEEVHKGQSRENVERNLEVSSDDESALLSQQSQLVFQHANKSLSQEDYHGGKIEGSSRLKLVDHHLRQQQALQQLGMIQQNAWRPQRGLPERLVSVLRAWPFEHFLHPYPKEKIMLAKQTGLTRSQVSNWFINARVRLWKPIVEEMYLEEIKEHEQNDSDDKTSKSHNNEDSTSKSTALDRSCANNMAKSSKQDNIPNQNGSSMSISMASTSPLAANIGNQLGFSLV
ncbi:hypothetical protein GQ457_13G012070 [Hibiscus cannabinus]